MVLPPKKRTRDSRFSLVLIDGIRGLCYPNPLGIFRFGLAPAGIAGPAGHPEGTHRVASLQCSIFRCDTDTLRRVDSYVNHSIKLCFISPGVWFALNETWLRRRRSPNMSAVNRWKSPFQCRQRSYRRRGDRRHSDKGAGTTRICER
jgi:hypothetical protein